MNFKIWYRVGNSSGLCPSIHILKCQLPAISLQCMSPTRLTVSHTNRSFHCQLHVHCVSLHKNTSWYPHAQACAFLQHNLRQTPRNDPHNGDNPVNGYVPVVFFGNAGTDWLGTSRGSSCEGPSHHSALDSSQPCWHPSRQPPHTGTHIRKLQVSYTQIWGTSMLSSLTVTVGNNLPSDICSGLRSSRQTSRLKDSSKFLYIVTSSIVFIRF